MTGPKMWGAIEARSFPDAHPEPAEIRKARERAEMTQTEAGQLVRSSMRAWQQWEAGERRMHPGLWELFQIKAGSPGLIPRSPKK
jgi:putative transcriptional regulator